MLQITGQQWATVNTVMNIQVKNVGDFLTNLRQLLKEESTPWGYLPL
jgi:hypothetical protein